MQLLNGDGTCYLLAVIKYYKKEKRFIGFLALKCYKTFLNLAIIIYSCRQIAAMGH
jgi:hypothetical protein